VSTKDGASLLAPISLVPGVSATFKVDGQACVLTLKELDNQLIGDDQATFNISEKSKELSEKEKIEKLIEHIATLRGAKFIRNDGEHAAEEAAEHLRTKWKAAEKEILTARQFIALIATKSMVSDRPYEIRLANGTTVAAGKYLQDRLAELEK
jgi:hypothetical protein